MKEIMNGTKAAAYVRMSTEHQQYSTNNQMDVIVAYAAGRIIEIVKTYSDEGKSGLSMQGQDELARMIADVQNGTAEFDCILVYDVSRWGRFQDADESAYYEYICKRAGIQVHYCAEQFENDGSPAATIIKGVKRAMAGEYSRELSAKVFQGACRLIQMGYKQGGSAGFGLRRMLIDLNGNRKGILKHGEQKSIQTDRVILVAGPAEEVALVRSIYDAFVNDGQTESEIATNLNAKNIKTDLDRLWTRGTVHQVLTNEKYIGNNIYHRTSFKLKKKHVENPPEQWIRADGVFERAILSSLRRLSPNCRGLEHQPALIRTRASSSSMRNCECRSCFAATPKPCAEALVGQSDWMRVSSQTLPLPCGWMPQTPASGTTTSCRVST
jgi:DNA invertase Pin-like site-specific DNA recombinase